MEKEKKKFKDSALFGAIKNLAPEILDKATDIASTIYPPLGIVNTLVDSGLDALKNKGKQSEEAIAQLKEARAEYTEQYLEFYKMEVEDRKSARLREVALAQAGKFDFMMILSGLVGLACFSLIVYAVLFTNLPENALIHQLIGMVEGVAVSIFAYYFGSSKGSKDKDKPK
jgi:hypothetical protein